MPGGHHHSGGGPPCQIRHPHPLCYLKDINEIGACRMCMVEVEDHARLVPACDSAVARAWWCTPTHPVSARPGSNLRLLLSQHETKCTKCTRSGNCKLQQLTNDYNLLGDHYIDDLKNIPTDFLQPGGAGGEPLREVYALHPGMRKGPGHGHLGSDGHRYRTTVGVSRTQTLGESDCTFCGQCITHCPVGGLQEHDDTGKVFDALANTDRITWWCRWRRRSGRPGQSFII